MSDRESAGLERETSFPRVKSMRGRSQNATDDEEDDEERPLLDEERRSQHLSSSPRPPSPQPEVIGFGEDDAENPRAWSRRKKLTNVGLIALMAILSPLASAMFTPGIKQIAHDLDTDEKNVIATTTGFVVMLGLGPLVLAPFSETFGRRNVYLWCFASFTLLQIPTALAPNVQTLIILRTIAGFFGSESLFLSLSLSPSVCVCLMESRVSNHLPTLFAHVCISSGVGIANGGGTISDMYLPSQRAGVFGWYLLGPLLGPTLGPLFGGIVVSHLNWRWLYGILTIVCLINTTLGYVSFFPFCFGLPANCFCPEKQRLPYRDIILSVEYAAMRSSNHGFA